MNDDFTCESCEKVKSIELRRLTDDEMAELASKLMDAITSRETQSYLASDN